MDVAVKAWEGVCWWTWLAMGIASVVRMGAGNWVVGYVGFEERCDEMGLLGGTGWSPCAACVQDGLDLF